MAKSFVRARRSLAVALTSAVVLSSVVVIAKQKAKGPETIPGQFVVELSHSSDSFDAQMLERTFSGKVIDRVRDNMIVVQRNPLEAPMKALESIRNSRFVVAADPNWIMRASKTPNDTEFGKLWGMSNSGGVDSNGVKGLKGIDIGAAKAWDKTTGSKDVIVAIIDTGVDFKIPDLTSNAWTNEKELNGKAGVDDDGNGYVDDIHGYNFVANTGDSTDDQGHGSHCAGTIGARGDDGAGVAGVNWNVSIMAVKFLDANGSGSLANAIKAIDYARKNGAKVLSNSWGGGAYTKTLFDAIAETEKADELFIAAAGNDGTDSDKEPAYPASYKLDNIISVAAIDMRGELADFSNYGATTVHIAAPGVGIYSTAPAPENFQYMSGTSMATPHVAGAAALLYADNLNQTYAQVKQRLLKGARPLHSLRGKVTTGGLLDVSYALSGDTPPADPNDPTAWPDTLAQAISSPHPYGDKFIGQWTINVPGAEKLSVHFARFETEANYDKVMFYSKTGELLSTMSGSRNGDFGPIIDGDTVIVKMTSDDSVNGYGFDVDSISYVKSSVVSPTPTPVPTPLPTPVPLPEPEPAPTPAL